MFNSANPTYICSSLYFVRFWHPLNPRVVINSYRNVMVNEILRHMSCLNYSLFYGDFLLLLTIFYGLPNQLVFKTLVDSTEIVSQTFEHLLRTFNKKNVLYLSLSLSRFRFQRL